MPLGGFGPICVGRFAVGEKKLICVPVVVMSSNCEGIDTAA